MKKLVLFSDGTGNSSAKAEKTNVWRMFDALDQSTPDQLAKYDDGVGTSSNKYLAALGGAFGFGLKRNVIDLYKFVCRNHQDGDEIHGFGFSRGSFTIRVVVGLIATQGLVKGRSESELDALARAAYRQYRVERFKSRSPLVWIARGLRDGLVWLFKHAEKEKHLASRPAPNSIPIKFLGLFDTVGAYGMPVEELKRGLSMLVWPMTAIDRQLFPCVERGCHALALDDQRETFHPTLFDEEIEARLVEQGGPAGRLTQVWFAGVHSNVGGGYPEDKASLVPLDWMMSQAIAAGLRFNPASVPEIANERSAFARLYDSRAGVAAYYRYSPRQIRLGRYPNGKKIRPIVHGSVVMRMAEGSDAYAPISLPEDFDVLAPDGRLLPMHGFKYADAKVAMRGPRPRSSTAEEDVVAARTVALQAAIAKMGSPDSDLVVQVQDTVWWRRLTYFACLAATVLLVAFPFASSVYGSVLHALAGLFGPDLDVTATRPFAWVDQVSHGGVKTLVDIVGPLAPKYLDHWLDALEARPAEMAIALLLVAVPFALGKLLGDRIHDRAWFAWHPAHRSDYVDWVKQSAARSRVQALVLCVACAGLLGVGLVRGWDGHTVPALAIALLICVAILVWRSAICRRLKRLDDSARSLPSTPTLQVANRLRHSVPLTWLYTVLAENVLPFAFGIAVLGAGACAVYHLAYEAGSAFGSFCADAPTPGVDVGATELSNDQFKTSDMCWASGFKVAKGVSYQVTLTTTSEWRDRSVRTDAAGFAADSAVHVLATPMKRLWAAHWFAPVLRVGSLGSDDLVMPPAPRDAQPDPQATRVAELKFIAPRDGELFLYVNDAVLLVPGSSGLFYGNNAGTATLKVRRIADLQTP